VEVAGAVQTTGFGSALRSSRYWLMAACSLTIEWKVRRRIRWQMSAEKNVSTAFSHDPDVGVRWNVQRGWRERSLHLRMLVGGIVVDDSLDYPAGWHRPSAPAFRTWLTKPRRDRTATGPPAIEGDKIVSILVQFVLT
jgi:hypothetical protein